MWGWVQPGCAAAGCCKGDERKQQPRRAMGAGRLSQLGSGSAIRQLASAAGAAML